MKNHHVVQGLRLAVGFTLALGLTTAYHYPDASWVVISIVVVLSTSHERSAVLKKALYRIGGTLAGLAAGLIGLWLAQHSLTLLLGYMFIVTFAAGTLMHGKYAYIAIIAGITLAVIASHAGDWTTGLWRAGNVFIGATAGTVIALLIPHKKPEGEA